MRSAFALLALSSSLVALTAAAEPTALPVGPVSTATQVPAPVTTAPIPRRSTAMMATGISLWALGGLTTTVGIPLTILMAGGTCVNEIGAPLVSASSARRNARERVGTARQADSNCGLGFAPGLGIIGGGVILGAAGIPLFVFGKERRPVESSGGLAVPSLHVGATGADLRWRF